VSLPLMLAVVGILPLVIWLADLLPPLAGMAWTGSADHQWSGPTGV